jgi:hypothetical protein
MEEGIKRDELFSPDAVKVPLDVANNFKKVIEQGDKFIKTMEKMNTKIKSSDSISKLTKDTQALVDAEIELEGVSKELTAAEEKLIAAYLKKTQQLANTNKVLKDKNTLTAKEARELKISKASYDQLEAALKKNREEYRKLTIEESKSTKQGKELNAVIKAQTRALQESSAAHGQNVSSLSELHNIIGGITPGFAGMINNIKAVTAASLRFIATPIGATLAAIGAALAVAGISLNAFFKGTLEGEEQFSQVGSTFTAVSESIQESLADLGKLAFDNPAKAIGKILVPGPLLLDILEKIEGKRKIAIELAKIENMLVKERIRDTVDDANTELLVNEELEKSKNKLLYTDRQRLSFLDRAIVLLKEQLDGDIILAKQELAAAEQKIKLNGGIIQQNKLLSQYTDEELIAIKANGEEINELAKAQVNLLKVESDAAAKRKGFTRLRSSYVIEIETQERKARERMEDAQDKFDLEEINSLIRHAEQIADNDKKSGDDRARALLDINNLRVHAVQVGLDKELGLIKRAAEERIRAEGGEAIILKGNETVLALNKKGAEDLLKFKSEAYKEDLNLLNLSYKNGEISSITYENRRKEIIDKGEADTIEIIKAAFAEKLKSFKGTEEEYIALTKAFNDLILKENEKAALEELEVQKRVAEEKKNILFNALDLVSSITNRNAQTQLDELDRVEQAYKEFYDRDIKLAGDNEQKKQRIEAERLQREKEIDKQRRQIARKQAQYEKALAITRATINVALAVTENIGVPILAALIALAGAVEIAAISAQPIPAAQFGIQDHKGGLIRVSEVGPELAILPGNRYAMTPNTESIINLPKGSSVIPHDETMRVLARTGMKPETLGTIDDSKLKRTPAKQQRNNGIPMQTLIRDMGKIYLAERSKEDSVKIARQINLGRWV